MAKMKKWKRQKPGDQEFELIPPGKYPAMITKTEVKKTKAKTGEYLQLEFTLTKKHKGRKVWAIFNLWNDNVTACEIAAKEFASLEEALGKKIDDTSSLEKKKILLGVKTQAETKDKKGNVEYAARSVPAGYFSLKKGKGEKAGKKNKKGNKKPW